MTELQRKMVEDLLEVEEGLTAWELDFLENMAWRASQKDLRPLSEKQATILEKVYEERI